MLEIPEIITKTRKLLVLRGFQVNELLEFEDRFVMYPEKIEDTSTAKAAVWVFKEERVVGVALVKEIENDMEEKGAKVGVLVGGSRFTPAAKKHARSVKVELVEGGYSSFDLFGHELVPSHVIADDDEIQMVLDHFGIDRPELPRILVDDPAARMLGAKPGQVMRVERNSPTAGKTYYYRLVVDPAHS